MTCKMRHVGKLTKILSLHDDIKNINGKCSSNVWRVCYTHHDQIIGDAGIGNILCSVKFRESIKKIIPS